MNFKVDFEISQKKLDEIVNGYFRVWDKVSMLRESINMSQNIYDSNTGLVCRGVRCIQETLFYSSVVDIQSWFIDEHENVASLRHIISNLKDEHFSKKLETWYSKPPSAICQGNTEKRNNWHESWTVKSRKEFQFKKSGILRKYELFFESNERKRVAALRDKYIAHKDFKNSKLYDAAEEGHQFSDAEAILNLLSGFIFDLNQLFNKFSYPASDFDRVSEAFWGALKTPNLEREDL